MTVTMPSGKDDRLQDDEIIYSILSATMNIAEVTFDDQNRLKSNGIFHNHGPPRGHRHRQRLSNGQGHAEV